MKHLLLLSCFIGTIIHADRQINLEDIERDNLASEKQTNESSQKPKAPEVNNAQPNYFPVEQQQFSPVKPPPINYYSRSQDIIQPPKQYIPTSQPLSENYYRGPQSGSAYSPQELAEYITDNHLKSGPQQNQQQNIPRIAPQIPQQYYNQRNQQYFLIPPFQLNPYNHQHNSDGIQYIMYLQPTTAASFLAPETHIPNFNSMPNIMSLSIPQASGRLYTQSHQKISPLFTVPAPQFQPQKQQPHQILIQPQRKLVIQPEFRFMTIQPQSEKSLALLLKQNPQPQSAPQQFMVLTQPDVHSQPQPEPQQFIVVPQPEAQPQHQIKNYPKSLLDSYVPSVLQLQYLNAQKLKTQELQQEQFSKQVSHSAPQQNTAGAGDGEHLLNTIDYNNIPEQKVVIPSVNSAASTKRFAYQNYFPIQHGNGGTSYVNYRLGRYADH